MKTLFASLAVVLGTVFAFPAIADDLSTWRVVAVETENVDRYIAQLKIGKKLIKGQDANWSMSAFQSTFAGPATGTVIVAVQYPGGLFGFAWAWEANMASEEISEWLGGLAVQTSRHRDAPRVHDLPPFGISAGQKKAGGP
jgi:hypothetical protein